MKNIVLWLYLASATISWYIALSINRIPLAVFAALCGFFVIYLMGREDQKRHDNDPWNGLGF